ncbi:MAG: DUF4037 domain-containing protein [Komarekiella atlantica HA4396-MV6]|nr:DUF4037 domain-containing protein [Komarekiella atlantica HA4396-MV6]
MSEHNYSSPKKSSYSQEIFYLADSIAAEFSKLPQVVAVVLAGSQTSLVFDDLSDLDFYVYLQEEISVDIRESIAKQFSDRSEINNQFWEPGDEWIDKNSGRSIDIMYRTLFWIEQQMNSVVIKHQASVGYSTCFWWNILYSKPLYDKNGWFRQLQIDAKQPYPEGLRRAIITKNYPILRNNISSYIHQIELAINRNDLVSINHRLSALIASYFDIIFAINYLPHPGEKRLIQFAQRFCSKLPIDMEERINKLILAISLTKGHDLIDQLNKLIDDLDVFLINEKVIKESKEVI